MSFPHNLDLLPPASKLELIIVLAPSSLFLLSNVGKRLSTGNFTHLDSSKSSDSSKSVYFSKCLGAPYPKYAYVRNQENLTPSCRPNSVESKKNQ